MATERTGDRNQAGKRDRVPATTKIFYGLGTALDMWGFWLYPGVAFAVFNIYLGVEPWLVGLALTLIRVWDAFTDPIAGWLSDNLRSKHGRRRPFILGAGVLSGLGLPFLFAISPAWSSINFLGVGYFLVHAGIIVAFYSNHQCVFGSL
jgi:GPH family glycoside/pentoside/hexuronide:cation symporter